MILFGAALNLSQIARLEGEVQAHFLEIMLNLHQI